jgi:hypothetical protein
LTPEAAALAEEARDMRREKVLEPYNALLWEFQAQHDDVANGRCTCALCVRVDQVCK